MCRQIKEQSKKLVGVKRNQQLEREKHAQLLNEVKKQGDQEDERVEYYQVTGRGSTLNSGWGTPARTDRVLSCTKCADIRH